MDTSEMEARLGAARVIPVVSVRSEEQGRETVDRLVAAGAGVIEIVLRSRLALQVLAEARARHPRVGLAAGTVLDAALYDAAVAAGADFAISPGLEAGLADHARRGRMPLIPGALTPSEVMTANRLGYVLLKYYPAEPTNGSIVLADYANVFPQTRFMPTGKISADVLPAYAGLPNVLCVGGSWLFADGARLRSVDDVAALLASGRAAFARRP